MLGRLYLGLTFFLFVPASLLLKQLHNIEIEYKQGIGTKVRIIFH